MNLVWEPGNKKQGYVVYISVSCDNGEITSSKRNVEIIFSKYHYHYGMVKCRRIVNFEEMDTESTGGQQEKIMDFEYCEEYLN